MILFCEIEVGVVSAYVDVHEDEIGFEDGAIDGIVEIDVEHVAVAAPVAAKIQQDTLMLYRGGLQGCCQFLPGLGRSGVDIWSG